MTITASQCLRMEKQYSKTVTKWHKNLNCIQGRVSDASEKWDISDNKRWFVRQTCYSLDGHYFYMVG